MDKLTVQQRSDLMSRIKSRGSTAEMIVRSVLHQLDYRFRLHRKDLPGSPDLVFPGMRKVIFVHGCFWHAHSCTRGQSVPKTNVEFWVGKITGNKRRDGLQLAQLRRDGWRCLVIWECEIKTGEWLTKALRFLET